MKKYFIRIVASMLAFYVTEKVIKQFEKTTWK